MSICFVGLNKEIYVVFDNERFEYFAKDSSKKQISLCGNIKTKQVTGLYFQIDDTTNMLAKMKEVVIDLDSNPLTNGARWEGHFCDGKLFGYGEYYGCEGDCEYIGFVCDGKKVGYGFEYFTNTRTLKYCGLFVNNKRHGWGIAFSQYGEVLYKGEWRFGKINFTTEIIVEDHCNDIMIIHDLIEILVIGEFCYNNLTCDLELSYYRNLRKFIIKKDSFKNIGKFTICCNDELEEIIIENSKSFESTLANTKEVIIESNSQFFPLHSRSS